MNILIEKKQTTLLDLSKNLWMTNEHLKKLNTKGHKIGLHAYNHPTSMSDLSYTEQKKQITMNYDHIFSTINVKPDSMSYPNNSYNKDTIQIIKSLGIKCSFRSNLSSINPNSPLKQFFIPRRDHSTFN